MKMSEHVEGTLFDNIISDTIICNILFYFYSGTVESKIQGIYITNVCYICGTFYHQTLNSLT